MKKFFGKKISTSWGIITLFAATVLFFGGAFTYYYYYEPVDYGSGESYYVPIKAKTANQSDQASATADWKTYTNDTYGFSFKYPKDWESTKKEETAETSLGSLSKDLLYKISFYNTDSAQKIACANNQYQNWKDSAPSQEECKSVLAGLTAEQISNLQGPRNPENIFVRVFRKTDASISLHDWLYNKYHQPNTELEKYQVAKEITLDGQKGYLSSIGCCGGIDRSYVIEANGYVIMLGSNYFDNSITDKEMPVSFEQIAKTFKVSDLMASWKTYNSTDFTIKYPNAWSVKDYDNGAGLYSSVNVIRDASGVVQPNIIISKKQSLATFVNNEFGPSSNLTTLKDAIQTGCAVSNIASQTITLAGHTAYWAYYKDAVTIFVDEDNNMSGITYMDNAVKIYNDLPAESKAILSTLQLK